MLGRLLVDRIRIECFTSWPVHVCKEMMSCQLAASLAGILFTYFFFPKSGYMYLSCVFLMFVLSVKSHLVKSFVQWEYSGSQKVNEHPVKKCCSCIPLTCFQYINKNKRTVKLYFEEGFMIATQRTSRKMKVTWMRKLLHVLVIHKILLHRIRVLLRESRIKGSIRNSTAT